VIYFLNHTSLFPILYTLIQYADLLRRIERLAKFMILAAKYYTPIMLSIYPANPNEYRKSSSNAGQFEVSVFWFSLWPEFIEYLHQIAILYKYIVDVPNKNI
jgi:hypothetical protein